MKHVIIGTAGHVDHGKTALVKALTGIDTDRLEEEKRRGVTIELGFAYIDFEDGTRAGIVDVPGHERFIRNMLAGAGGIDIALLVVGADESVMPQTREHLDILGLLGIRDGLVAVTKCDKADPDWMDLVIEDVKALVKGTFLEGSPVVPVSALTGEGLSELKRSLRAMIDSVTEKEAGLPFRLPVDRVFPVDGFGIVVTGTLIEGSVAAGSSATILPSGEKTQIRSVNVHGKSVAAASAGQRTALCLSGVKRGSVKRGDVIAAAGSINVTSFADVKIIALPGSGRTIKTGDNLHVYHGARTLLAKAKLPDRGELLPGESCYARLGFSEPLPCKRGDRFVLRFYSPLVTIGGGMILDSSPNGRFRGGKEDLEALKIRETGGREDVAELAGRELGGVFSEEDLCRKADLRGSESREALAALEREGRIRRLLPARYISPVILSHLAEKCARILSAYHTEHPLRSAMNTAELRQKLLPDTDIPGATAVLDALEADGKIALSEKGAALPDFRISPTPLQEAIRAKLLDMLAGAGFDAPSPDEIAEGFTKPEKAEYENVLESMISFGDIVALSQQVYWAGSVYDKAVALVDGYFENAEEITLGACRDLLGTSRKYALAFLECLDRIQMTRKFGDVRKPLRGK